MGQGSSDVRDMEMQQGDKDPQDFQAKFKDMFSEILAEWSVLRSNGR